MLGTVTIDRSRRLTCAGVNRRADSYNLSYQIECQALQIGQALLKLHKCLTSIGHVVINA